MNFIINKIERMDILDWLFIAVAYTVLTFFVCVIFSDKNVRCYYPVSYGTDSGIVYRVKADIDWIEDITAFSSANPDETIAFYNTLKKCAE